MFSSVTQPGLIYLFLNEQMYLFEGVMCNFLIFWLIYWLILALDLLYTVISIFPVG